VEDSFVTRTFTTRLRATLTAVGLFVATTATTVRAGDGLLAVKPEAMPSPQAPVVIQGPAPTYTPTSPGTPGTVHPDAYAAPGGIVHGGPNVWGASEGGGCGEKIYGGGMGYLMSGCGEGGCTSSLWYWKADYLHLRRDIDNARTFINAQLPTGEILSARIGGDDFGWDPAVRFTFGMALIESSACDLFLEGTYFGLHHANLEGFNEAPPGVALFGSPLAPLFDATTAQAFSYVSDLHSGEVNLKWDYYVDNTLYLLLGVRYIRFDDRLRIRENGALVVAPAFQPQAFERVRITNNLIGLQIGFDWQTRDLTSRWNLGTYGRAGLYANILDGQIEQGANASLRGVFFNEINPGRLQASGALEFGVVGTYRITPSLHFRGGYHALWLMAIGLAPDQPVPDLFTGDFNGRLSNNQDVFFHGPFVGLEYHWGCCR
jgi:hypothetical protein